MAATQLRWYRRARIWITDKSKGVNELLAAAGEPLMRYATIYLALATGIPYIKFMPAYTACQGIVISVPEFVILGALGVAEGAASEAHNKKWGIALYGICALLAAIMIATFVDIFIWQFPDIAVKSLNFARCIVAVGFSIVLGKLDQDEPQSDQSVAQTPAQQPAVPAAPVIDLTPLTDQIAKLTEQMEKLQAEKLVESQAETETESGQESGQSEDDSQAEEEDENGQEIRNNITVLRPRRQAKERAKPQAKNGQSGPSTKASKAAALIRRNPEISAPDLAKKAGIDVSYARKLLAKKEGNTAS